MASTCLSQCLFHLSPKHFRAHEQRQGCSISAVLIPIVISIFLSGVLIYRAFLHPLAKVPGPRLAGLTGWWRTYRYVNANWHDDVLDLHRKYGGVVRIAPDEVSVVDTTAMKRLFGHSQNSATKTSWYDVWQVRGMPSAMFAETQSKIHAQLRKRVSSAYSMSAILKFESYIQDCLDLCMVKLKKHADAGNVVDMSEWTNALAFDVVGELAFGQQFGHLRTESDLGGLRGKIGAGFVLGSCLGHLWGQMGLVNNVFLNLLQQMLGIDNPVVEMLDWSNKRVDSRAQGTDGAAREDMLSHFMKMKSLDGSSSASLQEITIEAMNVLGAGADTTSIGMRTCLYYLATNPKTYVKLQAEIDEYYNRNNLDHEPISFSQSQQIPFLKAFVNEALRLLPSIVFQLLRYSPPEGIEIQGHYIPAGYVVGISPRAQNRDRAVYGDDADEFRPDRWLNPAQASKLESSIMTFGGNGSRACIGKHIALVEINKFIAQLLRNFDVEFPDPENPWRIVTYWFAQQKGMNMRIRTRKAVSYERLNQLSALSDGPQER